MTYMTSKPRFVKIVSEAQKLKRGGSTQTQAHTQIHHCVLINPLSFLKKGKWANNDFGIVGSNLNLSWYESMYAFPSVCIVLCMKRGLAMGWSHV
jgi:hypothetical protein